MNAHAHAWMKGHLLILVKLNSLKFLMQFCVKPFASLLIMHTHTHRHIYLHKCIWTPDACCTASFTCFNIVCCVCVYICWVYVCVWHRWFHFVDFEFYGSMFWIYGRKNIAKKKRKICCYCEKVYILILENIHPLNLLAAPSISENELQVLCERNYIWYSRSQAGRRRIKSSGNFFNLKIILFSNAFKFN